MKKQTYDTKVRTKCCKAKRLLVAACIFYGIFGTKQTVMDIQAAQDTQNESAQNADSVQGDAQTPASNQIMVAEQEVDLKAEPDAGAQTLMTYQKGDLVFTTGETADGWYLVTYQDKNGYVEKDALSIQEIDIEGLDAEMTLYEQEGKLVMETVEKYHAEARRSKIWGGVIIVLVASIFAVGIFSAVKAKKEEESEKRGERSLEIEDWNV